MERLLAPVTSQASVALPPGPITRGLAAKELITGGPEGGATVMASTTCALPAAFVAVMVKFAEAAAAVGVPLTMPVAASRERPAGRPGAATDQEAGVPPSQAGTLGAMAVPTT